MNFLEPWCRNAYMDVALQSRAFVESALHVSCINNGDLGLMFFSNKWNFTLFWRFSGDFNFFFSLTLGVCRKSRLLLAANGQEILWTP